MYFNNLFPQLFGRKEFIEEHSQRFRPKLEPVITASLISGGLGLLGGLLGGRGVEDKVKKPQTTTFPTLTPEQQALMKKTVGRASMLMDYPMMTSLLTGRSATNTPLSFTQWQAQNYPTNPVTNRPDRLMRRQEQYADYLNTFDYGYAYTGAAGGEEMAGAPSIPRDILTQYLADEGEAGKWLREALAVERSPEEVASWMEKYVTPSVAAKYAGPGSQMLASTMYAGALGTAYAPYMYQEYLAGKELPFQKVPYATALDELMIDRLTKAHGVEMSLLQIPGWQEAIQALGLEGFGVSVSPYTQRAPGTMDYLMAGLGGGLGQGLGGGLGNIISDLLSGGGGGGAIPFTGAEGITSLAG